MTVKEMKFKFVTNELKSLLKAAKIGVEDVKYEVTFGGEEYVYVEYDNGSFIEVCVTADSLLAIVKDVLKAIDY